MVETEPSAVSSQMAATATADSTKKKYASAAGRNVQRSQLRIGSPADAPDGSWSVKLFFTTTPYTHAAAARQNAGRCAGMS